MRLVCGGVLGKCIEYVHLSLIEEIGEQQVYECL